MSEFRVDAVRVVPGLQRRIAEDALIIAHLVAEVEDLRAQVDRLQGSQGGESVTPPPD